MRPGEVERRLVDALQTQGFATSVRRLHMQSSIVYGARGACRVSVRDARNADGAEVVYAQQASDVGPVRYLYRGRAYASFPALRMRLGRFQTELLGRLHLDDSSAVPVALATSSACRKGNFGLDRIEAPA